MTVPEESKHQKFLRLADSRTQRALEAMRTISSLTSKSYEYKPNEAEHVMKVLSQGVHDTAKAFSIPFNARIGKAGTVGEQTIFEDRNFKTPVETSKVKIQVAKALELLGANDIDAAKAILVDLL